MKYNYLGYLLGLGVISSMHPLVNPDFGWHLRAGEQIWIRGEIPLVDWFSYTAENFPWVCHSWLQDLALYAFWCFGKILGSELFGARCYFALLGFAFVAICSRAFLSRETSAEIKAWVFLLLSISVVALKLLRPQVFTAIGFIALLWVFDALIKYQGNADDKRTKKVLLSVLLLMFAWANLHAGFVVAYVVIPVLLVGNVFDLALKYRGGVSRVSGTPLSWRTSVEFALAAILSLPLTLVNPYGSSLYSEVWRTMSDIEGKKLISEWQSFDISLSNSQLVVGALLALVVYIWWRKVSPSFAQLMVLALTLSLSLQASRHSSFFVLTVFWVILRDAHLFNGRFVHSFSRMRGVVVSFLVVIVAFQWVDNFNPKMPFSASTLTSVGKHYPVEIFQYSELQSSSLKVMTLMGWSGFMLFANPQAKVFADGRMVHWYQNGKSVFQTLDDYVWSDHPDTGLIDSTGTDLVILPSRAPLAELLGTQPDSWEKRQMRPSIAIFLRKKSLIP